MAVQDNIDVCTTAVSSLTTSQLPTSIGRLDMTLYAMRVVYFQGVHDSAGNGASVILERHPEEYVTLETCEDPIAFNNPAEVDAFADAVKKMFFVSI